MNCALPLDRRRRDHRRPSYRTKQRRNETRPTHARRRACAAIKLDPLGKQLAIGEGLETAMAARQLGYGPAWALGSVGAISRFPIIDCVKTLIILGERGDVSAQA